MPFTKSSIGWSTTGSPFEEMSWSTMKAGLPTDTGIGGSIVSVVPTVAAGAFASTLEANENRLIRMIVSAPQARRNG
jgi:glutaminase